jgi:glycosyltransferase involved in cell wall biosynthesis
VIRSMTKVLLINQEQIPQYRVLVYNYLSAFLEKRGFALTVVSAGIPAGNVHPVSFAHQSIRLGVVSLSRAIRTINPDVVIYWVRLRHLYLFPMLAVIKALRKRMIYWGHGRDLSRPRGLSVRGIANSIEYCISDAMILYAEHLRPNVSSRLQHKVFVANNTLHFDTGRTGLGREECLARYKIRTPKNIICTGRMQRRKRMEDLFAAFSAMNRPDVGLILVGPDPDGVLDGVAGPNIYKLGPIYGDERLDLLAAADVFCLPGAVGLSIVDAFHAGLPFVTEEGDESPEIMYLKPGVNGFVVPRGDVQQLAAKLQLLLDDDTMRTRFSRAARAEVESNAHIDKMCQGFEDALAFVSRGRA